MEILGACPSGVSLGPLERMRVSGSVSSTAVLKRGSELTVLGNLNARLVMEPFSKLVINGNASIDVNSQLEGQIHLAGMLNCALGQSKLFPPGGKVFVAVGLMVIQGMHTHVLTENLEFKRLVGNNSITVNGDRWGQYNYETNGFTRV